MLPKISALCRVKFNLIQKLEQQKQLFLPSTAFFCPKAPPRPRSLASFLSTIQPATKMCKVPFWKVTAVASLRFDSWWFMMIHVVFVFNSNTKCWHCKKSSLSCWCPTPIFARLLLAQHRTAPGGVPALRLPFPGTTYTIRLRLANCCTTTTHIEASWNGQGKMSNLKVSESQISLRFTWTTILMNC